MIYIKVETKNYIVDALTSEDDYLLEWGYVKFNDSNEEARSYFTKTYGKPIYDEKERPNFFYKDGVVSEISEKEKEELFPDIEPVDRPSEQDLINADIYMQLAQLQMAGGLPMTTSTISPRYNLLKRYYDMGIYNDENMKVFVACGWLTADEYQEITGSIYVA